MPKIHTFPIKIWFSESQLELPPETRSVTSQGWTTARNASDFVEYLKARAAERVGSPEVYLASSAAVELKTLREAEAAVGATEVDVSTRLYVGTSPTHAARNA